jgi:hypothetical protein
VIRQTVFARDQASALFEFYLEKDREQAYENLLKAIAEAASRIEADPTGGLAHPKPYPGMAKWGFRWIKVHLYWFGWSIARGYPLVTNIFFETSRMWARIAPDEGDEEPF